MPATTGGRPTSGTTRSGYRRRRTKPVYKAPSYGSEKTQSPKSAPKTGSNPTGSGRAPASRIAPARRRRQKRSAEHTLKRVTRRNRAIRKKKRQDRKATREYVERQA